MELLLYPVLLIVVIGIYVAVSRWIFRVNDHIENQETIIQLLGQLLLRQGLSVEEVRKIINPGIKK